MGQEGVDEHAWRQGLRKQSQPRASEGSPPRRDHAQGRPLRASEKRFNRLIAKRRFRLEQCFGTMKRLFGLARARYSGVARTHARLAMAAIAQNLLKAAIKIKLNPHTPAIA